MQIKTFKGGYDSNFTYVIYHEKDCCILDPAVPAKEVLAFVKEKELDLQFVVFLHSHFDHVVDLKVYREKGIPIYGHELTKILIDRRLKDGEIIPLGDTKIKVLHTPGHRYDCICLLLDGKHLFTSDTLFVEGCGRVDFEGSDPELMVNTLEKLKQLPDDVIIYPGHDYGSTETSTVGREKKNNRFLKMGKDEFLKMRLRRT
ncbi:Zn-dependent hydrolase [Candidatus Woesearchaeota archaeon CG10_big_fil_rev_8_21_14_0_10_45_16]|nr:MAG: Zn-dependent hydrolase [Candidatus Woesearchaeota archaeon CG10_big_fil_rev_8_21_14_0_10_45_16]